MTGDALNALFREVARDLGDPQTPERRAISTDDLRQLEKAFAKQVESLAMRVRALEDSPAPTVIVQLPRRKTETEILRDSVGNITHASQIEEDVN